MKLGVVRQLSKKSINIVISDYNTSSLDFRFLDGKDTKILKFVTQFKSPTTSDRLSSLWERILTFFFILLDEIGLSKSKDV